MLHANQYRAGMKTDNQPFRERLAARRKNSPESGYRSNAALPSEVSHHVSLCSIIHPALIGAIAARIAASSNLRSNGREGQCSSSSAVRSSSFSMDANSEVSDNPLGCDINTWHIALRSSLDRRILDFPGERLPDAAGRIVPERVFTGTASAPRARPRVGGSPVRLRMPA